MKNKFFYWFGLTLTHIGWGFYGQECYCSHRPTFNWLARMTWPWMQDDQWADITDANGRLVDQHPVTRTGRVFMHIGDWLVQTGSRVLTKDKRPAETLNAEEVATDTPPPPPHDPCRSCRTTESSVWLNGLCEKCAGDLYQ